ncbi:hypothetical protein LRD69_29230 [Streptomyces sp. JH14]|nr:hypothetical protein [Streptomyces sp. JH14]MDF6046136.1 hypothetical protein [Streptomyces sp. JH14]
MSTTARTDTRVAIVTGAARNIGAVAVLDLDADACAPVVAEIETVALMVP